MSFMPWSSEHQDSRYSKFVMNLQYRTDYSKNFSIITRNIYLRPMATYILLTQNSKLVYTRELHHKQNHSGGQYGSTILLPCDVTDCAVTKPNHGSNRMGHRGSPFEFGSFFLNFWGMWRSDCSTIFTRVYRIWCYYFSSYRVALQFILLLLHATTTHLIIVAIPIIAQDERYNGYSFEKLISELVL
jgi:hypothetical protein